MKKLDLSKPQRAFLYENLKDALDQKFDSLGGKDMKDVYGPTTQVLIREAIYTYCFFKEIKADIKEVKKVVESTLPDEENKTEIELIYLFKIPITLPVFGDTFEICREISQSRFGE